MNRVVDRFGLVADGAVLCVAIFGNPRTGFELADLGRFPSAEKLEVLKQKHSEDFAGVAGLWLNGKPRTALVNELTSEDMATLCRAIVEHFAPMLLSGKRDTPDSPQD